MELPYVPGPHVQELESLVLPCLQEASVTWEGSQPTQLRQALAPETLEKVPARHWAQVEVPNVPGPHVQALES